MKMMVRRRENLDGNNFEIDFIAVIKPAMLKPV
jgi:hypothetical protein